MKQKNIYILLTKHDDWLSKGIRWLTNCEYTHASIGTQDKQGIFYSFKKKPGFCTEQPFVFFHQRKQRRQCRLYSIQVDQYTYDKVQQHLNKFIREDTQYKYNLIGLICSFFKISYKPKDTYFCSQFVAEILASSNAMESMKDPVLYLPKDFTKVEQFQLVHSGTLGSLAQQM